jgi:hypothetical protein
MPLNSDDTDHAPPSGLERRESQWDYLTAIASPQEDTDGLFPKERDFRNFFKIVQSSLEKVAAKPEGVLGLVV